MTSQNTLFVFNYTVEPNELDITSGLKQFCKDELYRTVEVIK